MNWRLYFIIENSNGDFKGTMVSDIKASETLVQLSPARQVELNELSKYALTKCK